MINSTPYDKTTHSHPWLLERNNRDAVVGPEGIPLTASYIWSKNKKERESLVHFVFNYYRKKGFPYNRLTDKQLKEEFQKLINKDENEILNPEGFLNNSSGLGNDIYKSFVWEKYFSAKGDKKTKSVMEVFNNDELLLKVIKNRMGYSLTKEDGEERPYIFTISDAMIIQGIHSTSFGYNVSLFKPMIAKYIYKNYVKKNILDFSAGWGARALAAMSLNLEYYGIDPLTSTEVNQIINYFGGKGFIVNGVSEDIKSYKDIPKVDCVMSCPPYYNLETYSEDANQSSVKYKEYNGWIKEYWYNTVKNCVSILDNNGFFIMIIKDKVGNYNLMEDMIKVCSLHNLSLEKEIYYKTSNSHLSGKKKTKKITKNSEIVCIMRKK